MITMETMQVVDEDPERTSDDVLATLKIADIKEHELKNVTQLIYHYSSDEDMSKKFQLLELDDHLQEVLKNGGNLSFQGCEEEGAMLCTKSRTYDLRECETSNSMLLIPNLKLSSECHNKDSSIRTIEDRRLCGIFQTYFEVLECKPHISKLLTILDASSFKGTEYESRIEPTSLYDWNRLRSEIQSSEDELFQAMKDYNIVLMDGYYRLISFEAEARSVTLMLEYFEENSWAIDEVDKEATYNALKELVPEPIFNALFHSYTEKSSQTKSDGSPLYRYIEEKSSKLLAKVLLAACPVNEYNLFMESWMIGSPEKIPPKEEYLWGDGIIVWNSRTGRKEVISFPEKNLPENINSRFNELFKAKRKWTLEEITPYIKNLTSSKIDVKTLLTKYARCSTKLGIQYYSSKFNV